MTTTQKPIRTRNDRIMLWAGRILLVIGVFWLLAELA